MILSIIVGILIQNNTDFASNHIKPFGTILLNLIKLIVVPVVLFSIIASVISMKDINKVGSVSDKIIVFYIVTTYLAITLSLIFANILNSTGGYTLATDSLTYEAAAANITGDASCTICISAIENRKLNN